MEMRFSDTTFASIQYFVGYVPKSDFYSFFFLPPGDLIKISVLFTRHFMVDHIFYVTRIEFALPVLKNIFHCFFINFHSS